MILLMSRRRWPPVEGCRCSQCVNGGSLHDAGAAIGKSADEGIDGIIQEDRLRLDALLTQDPPIRTRVGQFDSALLRYAARLARRVEQGRSAYYSGSETRARSCARHVSQLDAMAIGSRGSPRSGG